MTKNPHIGSSFDDFLKDTGDHENATSVAIKRVIAWQLQEAMEHEGLSKNKMAQRMNTSRSQLDRVLDPEIPSVQLDTLIRAAKACGRELRIELT